MTAATTLIEQTQLVPMLGMVWRGMWGATVATAVSQVLTADESDETES